MIVAKEGINDLASNYPELAKEWHPTRNGDLLPSQVTCGSGKKVWWQCEKGHEWRALVSNRTKNKSGCPYCAGQLAIRGVNDLQTVNPSLAAEWDFSKNKETPQDVMSSSKRKYWWVCPNGHSWQATLDSRNRGHGCPYCSGRRAVEGVNDLQSLRPDIAKLWHPTKNKTDNPSNVTVASGRKFWWLGECGHEWQTKVSTMCDKKGISLCPVCSSQNRTSFPEQAVFYYIKKVMPDAVSRYGTQKKEIDIFVPSLMIGVEYDGLRYHTDKTVDKEKQKDLLFYEQGITIFHLKEYENYDVVSKDSTVWYRPWDNYIRLNDAIRVILSMIGDSTGTDFSKLDIDIERDNADILSLFMTKKLEDGFAALHPDLLEEWHPDKNGNLDPWLISEKSNQKFWWLGKCGHEWEARVSDRVTYSTGCPICSKKKQAETYRKNLIAKQGSLKNNFPDIAADWDYEANGDLTPDKITSGSNYRAFWKCSKCGHKWASAVSNRTRKGAGCSKCKSKSGNR